MKYRNKANGAVIEASSIISGGNWEKVAEKKPDKKTGKKPDKKTGKKPGKKATDKK